MCGGLMASQSASEAGTRRFESYSHSHSEVGCGHPGCALDAAHAGSSPALGTMPL